ncbi:hypothetical protein Q5P01_010200 [Channa striata]|uniref:Secreted protein n=1 Tax=Channa striata TaxID=64152 RepID=A0AA88N2P3_CHASR|nr:hypothetical protein Q5P01_010200 [Channa striata]
MSFLTFSIIHSLSLFPTALPLSVCVCVCVCLGVCLPVSQRHPQHLGLYLQQPAQLHIADTCILGKPLWR